MTKYEAVKMILAKGNCHGVDCGSCPSRIQESPWCLACGGRNKHGGAIGPNDATYPDEVAWFRDWLSSHSESPEGKPVDHFEVGKWYEWGSPTDIRKCVAVTEEGRGYCECFPPNTPANFSPYIFFAESFREVPAPGTIGREYSMGGIVETFKIPGMSIVTDIPVFGPSSRISSKASRRRDILSRLSID